MLTIEKLKQTSFSPTEKKVVDFILENGILIKDMTIREITQKNFSSPAILIKISKKMGFSGWNELKKAFLKDCQYLDSHFDNIDANVPFKRNDGITTISNKIATLYQTTIKDSLTLLGHDALDRAIKLIDDCAEIKIFGNNINLLISQDFSHKMNRIKYHTSISSIDGEQLFDACNCREDTCAVVISYSGETQRVLEILPILKRRKIPIIALTSLGDNSLAKQADCVLNITTREKLYSKIGNMSPNVSIIFTLDVLYSCIFTKKYDQNLAHVIATSKLNDPRISTTKAIKEEQ